MCVRRMSRAAAKPGTICDRTSAIVHSTTVRLGGFLLPPVHTLVILGISLTLNVDFGRHVARIVAGARSTLSCVLVFSVL